MYTCSLISVSLLSLTFLLLLSSVSQTHLNKLQLTKIVQLLTLTSDSPHNTYTHDCVDSDSINDCCSSLIHVKSLLLMLMLLLVGHSKLLFIACMCECLYL
ncbi:Hypothetical predicted protein [Octopus vulgaris]|uniref:Transmembrane protein n=1 Tax=Octopus vulgaris TaxID=6645 RepID=A0AA36AJA2_OCTVU|nr:Hypothetical predicted protein [Octopus vulgaris]